MSDDPRAVLTRLPPCVLKHPVKMKELRTQWDHGCSKILRPKICVEDGFNQGEISGIIRDYTGAKSALRHFQEKPRWSIQKRDNNRVIYEVVA